MDDEKYNVSPIGITIFYGRRCTSTTPMNSQEDERIIVVITKISFQAKVKDENYLWHLRFSHLNFIGSNSLPRKGMVKQFPLIENLTTYFKDASWVNNIEIHL